MTNLVALCIVVLTNTCPYQPPKGPVVERLCCVQTEVDVGTPAGRYLFTVSATDAPCLAWTGGYLGGSVHPDCIVFRRQDFRDGRKTPKNLWAKERK